MSNLSLKESISNVLLNGDSKKEEAIRQVEALIKAVEEGAENVEWLLDAFDILEEFVKQTKPSVMKGDVLALDPLMAITFDLIAHVVIVDKDCHEHIRDKSAILSYLTSCLGDKYHAKEQTRILQTIEAITRGISLTWVNPYISNLTKRILAILLNQDPSSEDFLCALRIITNVMFNNRSCVSIVVRDPSYRAVMKRFYSLFSNASQSNCSREVTALNLNFGYLSDPCITIRSKVQMENVKQAFVELLAKVDGSEINFAKMRSVGSSIYYLTLCVSTLINRIEKEYEESIPKPESKTDAGPGLIKSVTEEVIGIAFLKIFPKCLSMMRLENGKIILQSMLFLVKALCPSSIPPQIFNDLWDNFVKILNEISMMTTHKSRIHVNVLETHLYFVERITQANPNNFQVDAFTYALNNCIIEQSADPIHIIRNILIIRLMRRLNALAQLRKGSNDPTIAAKVNKVLKEEILLKLLNLLLDQTTADPGPSIEFSTCVVEILNVISKLPVAPTEYIESLQKETTWLHISKCILNGDQELMNQAFALMTTVGFSSSCVSGVSKMLLTMRENNIPVINKSPVKTPDLSSFLSMAALRGITILNSNLEMLQEKHDGEKDQAMEDVFIWYKMKNDLNELEVNNLKENVFQLHKTIAQLQTLFKKHEEMVAKRTLASASLKKDYQNVRSQLEATKERKAELELKHIKAIELLKTQLTGESELLKVKCERLATLEKEFKNLKDHCNKLESAKNEATQSSLQLTAEKRKLQDRLDYVEREWLGSKQKVANLENDLKKSEEGRKSAEAALESEKRKVQIIQQVLGDRQI